jgi:hypothetical protein
MTEIELPGITPGHQHATIGEAGQCPSCRDLAIAAVRETFGTSDLFHHYVLRFTDYISDPDPTGPDVAVHLGTAIVPGPDFATAIDNAWACGCNPGGQVGGQEIPHDLVYRAGPAIQTCVLLTGDAYEKAMEALRVATYHLDN